MNVNKSQNRQFVADRMMARENAEVKYEKGNVLADTIISNDD